MNNSANTMVVKLALALMVALALMMAQTAIAAHDIHCLDAEQDQMCSVCLGQDHGAESEANQHRPASAHSAEKSGRLLALVSPTSVISLYLSRAPPSRF